MSGHNWINALNNWSSAPPSPESAPPPTRGTPTDSVSSFDISRPGYSERAYDDVTSRLMSAQNRVGDAYNQVFDEYNRRQRPSQNFAGYYDNAVSNLGRDVDTAYAARGNFRGTAATNTFAREAGNLRGQQARDEGAFGLAADAQERQWMSALSDAAARGDVNEFQRISGLLAAARQADQGKMDRVGMAFNSTLGMGNALAGLTSEQYNALLRGDYEMLTDEQLARLGMTREQLAGSQRDQKRLNTSVKDLIYLYESV